MFELELPALHVDNASAEVATGRPLLINRDPGPDETAVPLGTVIALELVDPGPDGIDPEATRVWVNGILAFDGAVTPELAPTFAGPRAEIEESADTLRIVLHPVVPFESLTLVEVRAVSATSGAAVALDQSYSFVTEDRIAPRVVAAQARGQRSIRVELDEPVVVVDPTGFQFVPIDLPAVPLRPTAARAQGPLVTIEVEPEMTPDARYRVVVAGVTDQAGNPVEPPFDAAIFAGYRPPRPAARRFDLWSMLPKHNRREDTTGDLQRFIACLQEVLDLLLAEVDRLSDVFDLERAPPPFLERLLADFGNPFPFDLDELGKRRLAASLVQMYRQKGTAAGIQNAIRFFLGIELEAIQPLAASALVLGESELGVDWELGPSERFARYAFSIAVGHLLTDAERHHLRSIVNYLKPAHTHFVDLIEPLPPVVFDHWELGISELGLSTDLH